MRIFESQLLLFHIIGTVATERGRLVLPMRNSSMPRAASLPSASAHTTSDCPRDISPAANTPRRRGHLVGGSRDVTPTVEFDAELFEHSIPLRMYEAEREQN